MNKYKLNGVWYLPDDPKNRVAGTLVYNRRSLRLHLHGSFIDGWSASPTPYGIIHGVVSKNPWGEFVSLADSFTNRRELTLAGIVAETITCNTGIIGDSHLPPDYDGFESLDLRISYLNDWFGRRGLALQFPDNAKGLPELRYLAHDPTPFRIDGSELIIAIKTQWRASLRELNVSDQAQIEIRPLGDRTEAKLQAEFISPLQNLLSFATDTPNEVEAIVIRGKKVGEAEVSRRYTPIGVPIFSLRKKKRVLLPGDVLFTFDDANDTNANIFMSWFDFARRRAEFCSVYFSSLYAPPKYLEEKLLRLMSAFRLLATSIFGSSARADAVVKDLDALQGKHYSPAERDLIAATMPSSAEIEMPLHLLRSMEENQGLMSQIVGDDLRAFVRDVLTTLASVERRDRGRQSLRSHDALYYAIEKIRMLIKIIVLKDLGFPEEQVRSLIIRNTLFQHMRVN